jgi:hypothetical protein
MMHKVCSRSVLNCMASSHDSGPVNTNIPQLREAPDIPSSAAEKSRSRSFYNCLGHHLAFYERVLVSCSSIPSSLPFPLCPQFPLSHPSRFSSSLAPASVCNHLLRPFCFSFRVPFCFPVYHPVTCLSYSFLPRTCTTCLCLNGVYDHRR